MRTVTLREYVLEELNRRLAAQGRDVQIVSERPKPKLATDNIVKLERRDGDETQA
jgi:hypothetical protein